MAAAILIVSYTKQKGPHGNHLLPLASSDPMQSRKKLIVSSQKIPSQQFMKPGTPSYRFSFPSRKDTSPAT
jgi:hypothetical protein